MWDPQGEPLITDWHAILWYSLLVTALSPTVDDWLTVNIIVNLPCNLYLGFRSSVL